MENLKIEQFNPTVADLNTLVAITKDVVVTDLNDKKQLDVLKANRKLLRDARINITNRGKELRASALKFQKDVVAKEKELILILTPEENRLKAVDEEIKLKKLKAERLAVLPERIKQLHAVGDGREYDSTSGKDFLLGMDDVAFQTFLNESIAEKNRKDREIIEEKEAKIKKEEERLEYEKNAQEREAQARTEERKRVELEEKEKKEAEQKALAEHDRKVEEARAELEQQKAFIDFLKVLGWTDETKLDYLLQHFDDGSTKVYKLLGVYNQQKNGK